MIEYKVKVFDNGTKWYLNGNLHREDGPAVENANGDKSWWLNGKRYRKNGPAIEMGNGDKIWYLNDQQHREDGPAIELVNGVKSWYLNGIELTEDKFNAMQNTRATLETRELTVAEISKLLGYEVKIVK